MEIPREMLATGYKLHFEIVKRKLVENVEENVEENKMK